MTGPGGSGGGGAGLGGALFVQSGGGLVVKGSLAINGNSVASGHPAAWAYGSGIFLQGNGTLSFAQVRDRPKRSVTASLMRPAVAAAAWGPLANGASL